MRRFQIKLCYRPTSVPFSTGAQKKHCSIWHVVNRWRGRLKSVVSRLPQASTHTCLGKSWTAAPQHSISVAAIWQYGPLWQHDRAAALLKICHVCWQPAVGKESQHVPGRWQPNPFHTDCQHGAKGAPLDMRDQDKNYGHSPMPQRHPKS